MSAAYVPTYTVTLSQEQMLSLGLAIKSTLDRYAAEAPFFIIAEAPPTSHIGVLREMSENIEAAMLGNRRGGKNLFDMRMVCAMGVCPFCNAGTGGLRPLSPQHECN